MSTYNIREKFSYIMTTSSLEYIRNYNFNTTTITDIPLIMSNSDTEIPITVNITTTEPWVQVVDSTTGFSLKYPQGNVVLEPSSSKTVLVKIDLPPEIENIPEKVIEPSINIEILSGSFPVTSSQTTQQTTKQEEQSTTDNQEQTTSTGGGGSSGGAEMSPTAQF